MTYDTNPAHDDATGLSDGPSREDIEESVLDFDDANNGMSAEVRFLPHQEYEILIYGEIPGLASKECLKSFNRLWEFQDWAQRQESLADIALGESSTGIDQAWLTASRVLEGVSA